MKRNQVQVWRVTAGKLVRDYFTEHHAEQMARALTLNGMSPVIESHYLKDDALTRITVSA